MAKFHVVGQYGAGQYDTIERVIEATDNTAAVIQYADQVSREWPETWNLISIDNIFATEEVTPTILEEYRQAHDALIKNAFNALVKYRDTPNYEEAKRQYDELLMKVDINFAQKIGDFHVTIAKGWNEHV